MSSQTVRLSTSGMHCSSCSMLIDMTLSDLDGVEETSTDHATGISVVTFDDEAVSTETIIGAISSVGYEAEVTS